MQMSVNKAQLGHPLNRPANLVLSLFEEPTTPIAFLLRGHST